MDKSIIQAMLQLIIVVKGGPASGSIVLTVDYVTVYC